MVLGIESDADVAPWITVWPAERHQEAISRPDEAHLTILERDLPVGFILFAGLESSEGVIELRRIAVARRGAGVGRAAFAQALEYAFGRFNADRVWLDVLPENLRARRVYEEAGFQADRLVPAGHPSPDGPLPLLVMSIRRTGWEARQESRTTPEAG